MKALRFVKDNILRFGDTLIMPITKALLESSKLAYSRYKVDIEAKPHLQKKEEETNKRREAEFHKKKDDEDKRNSLISAVLQVSLFSQTL